MSDFPFSIPRRVDIPTIPFSYIQTDEVATIAVSKWQGPDESDEKKITQLSGLLITPTSESQKVILQLHIFGEWAINPYHGSVSFKRIVDGTETWLDPRATSSIGSRRPCNALFALSNPANNDSTPESLNTTLVDLPNTTKEVTYEVYLLQASVDSANFHLNGTSGGSDNTQHERGISTFTAECKG